jgi:hypothetical protein
MFVCLDENGLILYKSSRFHAGFIEIKGDAACGQLYDSATGEISNLKPVKYLEKQIELTKLECTRRIEFQWNEVGQRNVSIGSIYTVEQETDCKNWIVTNMAALSAILGRTDILDLDVTEDQYWPVYGS